MKVKFLMPFLVALFAHLSLNAQQPHDEWGESTGYAYHHLEELVRDYNSVCPIRSGNVTVNSYELKNGTLYISMGVGFMEYDAVCKKTKKVKKRYAKAYAKEKLGQLCSRHNVNMSLYFEWNGLYGVTIVITPQDLRKYM